MKYHFYQQPRCVKHDHNEVAEKLAGQDTDYLQNELFSAIEDGNYPLMDAICPNHSLPRRFGLQVRYFLMSRRLCHIADYPLQEVGVMTLNANPDNYFEDVEEIAFSPANLVPGIEPSLISCCKDVCLHTKMRRVTVWEPTMSN